ncbi:MAG: M20 family metallopeptidase [Candidatus Brockarchaeota archaeon]|nr:M20 family metallopeptidase [Candidatus Brockarchaeota archaeon]
MLDGKILKSLDPRKAVELTKRLVRAKSTNPPGNEGLASEVVAHFLDETGIEYEEHEVSDGRRNVVATLKGSANRPSLLFTSHLDVVPPGDEGLWSKDPFCGEEANGLIYGRGSTDAKSSLGAMLCAVEAVAESGAELSGDLVFAAVVGEETDNIGIKHLICKTNVRPSMALVGEPTRLRVANAHKGIARFNVRVKGKAAHASTPSMGANAISGMARVVLGLEELASRLRGGRAAGCPTLVVSTIKGGVKDNVVPPDCSITVDRRLVAGERVEKAEAEIKEVVAASLKGRAMEGSVELYLSAPPAMTPADEPIVLLARKAVEKVTGSDEGPCNFEAYCDMGPIVELSGAKTVILGPGSLEGSHVENEVVSVAEVEGAAKAYALFALGALSGRTKTG